MNKDKLEQFFKTYGFYVAVAIISVVAIVAVVTMPDGNVADEPNPYEVASAVDSNNTTMMEEIPVPQDEPLVTNAAGIAATEEEVVEDALSPLGTVN